METSEGKVGGAPMLSMILAWRSAQHMVAMNNDKGELWVLRRLKISNGNIQDLKAELAPDGQGATLRIPITCTASVSL